ncbi:MAG: alpha-1,2-fucosyltransferase [Bacteroidetes bacterium]|nr:MAG: alpha-1,2-fucosyltransferase [Bacteroidota bacterium]
MIITKLIGGIGNQMFQYAAGKSLAEHHGVELKLDISDFQFYAHRWYSLNHFNITSQIASDEEISKFIGKNKSKSLMILRERVGRLLPLKRRKIYYEHHFHFDEKFLYLPPEIYISGYWQSEKYFNGIESIILNEFSFHEKIEGMNEKLAVQIQDSNSISIHIRRGDYVSNKLTNIMHGVCGIDYYLNAVKYLSKSVEQPHLYVFSDEPEWARENLQTSFPMTFVNHNSGQNDFEDMRLLSLCKHHIIANSSFSWWGAWLCRNGNKIIIAPKRWFNEYKADTKDLYPEKWTIL